MVKEKTSRKAYQYVFKNISTRTHTHACKYICMCVFLILWLWDWLGLQMILTYKKMNNINLSKTSSTGMTITIALSFITQHNEMNKFWKVLITSINIFKIWISIPAIVKLANFHLELWILLRKDYKCSLLWFL